MSVERVWELIARKLAGEASESELKELDSLLKANPNLHFPLQTITDLWQQKRGADQTELEAAFQKHLRRMQEQGISFAGANAEIEEPATYHLTDHSRRRPWKFIAAAASVLVAGSLILHFSRSSTLEKVRTVAEKDPGSTSEIVTRNGSRTRIKLPDGSTVWLNAGSKLNYDKSFGVKLREVTLTGEAYFDVVRNLEVPFLIHTHRIDVRVLGTQFNVRSYPGESTEAALVKGSIEVSLLNDQSGKIILKPNQKIVVDADSTTHSTKPKLPSRWKDEDQVSIQQLTIDRRDGTTLETAWVENKLAFVEEPFIDVAKKLERWYGVSISFSDPKLEWIPLTGSFTKENVSETLYALSVAIPFKYSFTDSNTIVIGK
ncbi:MAG: FecR domain-containing protein [Chitinophagaceae bacterium]|nr:FecR domain-containing protein [Chitinophagaceae bacterium]